MRDPNFRVKVSNVEEPVKFVLVDLPVDVGFPFSVVPSHKLMEIGVKPIGKIKLSLADGKEAVRDVGVVFFELMGRRTVGPVVFGWEKDKSVLGVTVLETLGFLFDHKTGELKPKRIRF
ncbi:MAG: aspartyl protease [Candidatus Bathyarchaeia archaeon]